MTAPLQLFAPETLAALSPAAQSHLGPVLAQLEAFLVDNCTTAKDLAEVSQNGLLHRFMDSLPPVILDDEGEYLGSEKKAHLIGYQLIDDEYSNLPIIMALAHEGGLVSSLVAPNQRSQGLNITSLVHRLPQQSPQRLICTSGLLAGPKSAEIYRHFMKQMIDKHTSLFIEEMRALWEPKREKMRQWFHHMEQITGQKARFASEFQPTVDERSMKALTTRLEDFDLNEYEHLMTTLVSQEDGYTQREVIDSFFLCDAYRMLEQSQDTALVLKILTAKARFWAEKLERIPAFREYVTEQLLACALFTHPEHFKRAGFGLRNLNGLDCDTTLLTTQEILSGPLAYFSISRQTSNDNTLTHGLERLLAYAQSLVPEFSVDKLIEHSGFANSRVKDLLQLQGGHSQALEIILAEGALKPRETMSLLNIINDTQSYAAYAPKSLATILANLIKSVQFANADTPINHTGLNYLDEWGLKKLKDAYFTPAMAACQGLKEELIEYLGALDGVTLEHLQLTGLEAHEVPKVIQKMPLTDQGKVFSQDLGL